MSLACRECDRVGSFDTLIIFSPNGRFNTKKNVSDYRNFYTCCATIGSFDEIPRSRRSRFMIVKEGSRSSSFLNPNQSRICDCDIKRISEEDVASRLPNIHKAFTSTR